MKRTVYIILIVILSAIFLFSLGSIGVYYWNAFQEQGKYNELANLVEQGKQQETGENATDPTVTITIPQAGNEEEPVRQALVLREYVALYLQNQDMVGWIKIDGTVINYPVMQTPDSRDYYLNHNFNKESSAHGCIYAREACDINAPSDNIVLYGHHMRDGSMFASLDNYLKKSYWEEHRYIQFDTLTEHHTYEILAVFKTTASVGQGFAYHTFNDAADAAEFDEFVATCKELAFYDTGVTAEYGDKLITLSTCEYTQENGRLVVVAKRIS